MRIIVFILNQFSNFIDALSRPWRGVQHFFVRGLASADVTAGIQRWFNRILISFLTPFAALSDAWARVSRPPAVKFDSKNENRTIERRLQQVDQTTSARKFWLAILTPFVLPFGFVWLLFSTRRRGLLWFSVPLFAVAAVLGYAIYQKQYANPALVSERYRDAMAAAAEAGNFETARLFQAKLEQLGVASSNAIYRSAIALEQSGDVEAAEEKMSRIAPEDRTGYPGAHYWMATRILDGKIGDKTTADFERALTHIERLELSVTGSHEIDFLKGITLFGLGQNGSAVKLLEKAANEVLPAAGILMETAVTEKNWESAKRIATKVQVLLREREFNVQVALSETEHRWKVMSTGILGNEEAAELAVEKWLEDHPESPQARLQRALSILREYDRKRVEPGTDVEVLAERLVDAAKLLPLQNRSIVVAKFASPWQLRGTDERAKKLVSLLMRRDDLPAFLCDEIGTRLALEGDWNTSLVWLRQAISKDENYHRSLNNCAFVLSQLPDGDFWDEALGYADRAVALDPENAEYRDTRGMILFSLKRWQQSIEDLEIALNGTTDPALHARLSKAYEAIGNKRLAELHRRAGNESN